MNLKKRTIVFLGIIISIIFILLYFGNLKFEICGDSKVLCWRKFNLIIILSFLGPALLVSSLFTLTASKSAFQAWKKITSYFVIFYILIITLMPWSVGDEFAGFTKGLFGLVLCIVYTFFSAIYLLVNKNKL